MLDATDDGCGCEEGVCRRFRVHCPAGMGGQETVITSGSSGFRRGTRQPDRRWGCRAGSSPLKASSGLPMLLVLMTLLAVWRWELSGAMSDQRRDIRLPHLTEHEDEEDGSAGGASAFRDTTGRIEEESGSKAEKKKRGARKYRTAGKEEEEIESDNGENSHRKKRRRPGAAEAAAVDSDTEGRRRRHTKRRRTKVAAKKDRHRHRSTESSSSGQSDGHPSSSKRTTPTVQDPEYIVLNIYFPFALDTQHLRASILRIDGQKYYYISCSLNHREAISLSCLNTVWQFRERVDGSRRKVIHQLPYQMQHEVENYLEIHNKRKLLPDAFFENCMEPGELDDEDQKCRADVVAMFNPHNYSTYPSAEKTVLIFTVESKSRLICFVEDPIMIKLPSDTAIKDENDKIIRNAKTEESILRVSSQAIYTVHSSLSEDQLKQLGEDDIPSRKKLPLKETSFFLLPNKSLHVQCGHEQKLESFRKNTHVHVEYRRIKKLFPFTLEPVPSKDRLIVVYCGVAESEIRTNLPPVQEGYVAGKDRKRKHVMMKTCIETSMEACAASFPTVLDPDQDDVYIVAFQSEHFYELVKRLRESKNLSEEDVPLIFRYVQHDVRFMKYRTAENRRQPMPVHPSVLSSYPTVRAGYITIGGKTCADPVVVNFNTFYIQMGPFRPVWVKLPDQGTVTITFDIWRVRLAFYKMDRLFLKHVAYPEQLDIVLIPRGSMRRPLMQRGSLEVRCGSEPLEVDPEAEDLTLKRIPIDARITSNDDIPPDRFNADDDDQRT